MGRMYVVSFNAVSVAAAQDVFEIQPADDKPITIHELYLGQYSDAGDAEDELLGIQIIRGFTASGSGGSSATPAPCDPNNATAAGCTCEVNNTTVANTGTTTTLLSDSFNVRSGFAKIWTPETRIGANQGNTTIVVRITAPADALTMNGYMVIEEG